MRRLSCFLLFLALVLPTPFLRAQEAPAAAPAAVPAAPAASEESAPIPAAPASTSAEENKTEPPPAPAEFDEIVVKGARLQGHVISFGEKSIVFETIYGKGQIEVAYDDIEQFKTQNSFRFIQHNGESVRGRVAQLSTRDLVVAKQSGEVKLIKPDEIERVIPDINGSSDFTDKMHNYFPYTTVKFDLGWNLESGAVKKIELSGGLNIERRKAPTRFVLDFRAAYENDQKPDEPATVTKDEFRASLIGEYDLTGPKYAFFFPAAERDATRNIIIRAYPAIGVGYRLAETGKLRFQIQAGLAYVYEEFIDYPDNEYLALHFGFEGGYDFTNNYGVTWKTYYYPGLEDYTKNWLFRTEMAFSAKITKALSLNLRLTDTLDNTPAPDVGDNKFTTTLSLLFTF